MRYSATQPFPPDTKGFFYLNRPGPYPHMAAGSLRFRLVDTPDPSLFAQGQDLMLNGIPWSISVIDMKLSRYLLPLYQVLVSSEADRRISEMLKVPVKQRRSRNQVLNSILDTFCLDFSVCSTPIIVLDPNSIYQVKPSIFRWTKGKNSCQKSSYGGQTSSFKSLIFILTT